MEGMRKPFQGIFNIIRFNWHFYLIAQVGLGLLLYFFFYIPFSIRIFLLGAGILAAIVTILSLLVSMWVYDLSGFYSMRWLKNLDLPVNTTWVNVNAGFDETSRLIVQKFRPEHLEVMDFFHPYAHTEVSIRRARKAYPPYPGTKTIQTKSIPLPDDSVGVFLAIMAAHEIRDDSERAVFFREISRVLEPNGQFILVEHLRDVPNFLAYTVGAFHFLSARTWKSTFQKSGFRIESQRRHTPFLHIFTLQKDGDSA